jgi:hypothetical protein
MRNRSLLCVVWACALPAALAAEVQVNVRTSGSQANAAVAGSPDSGSVVVWSSYYTTAGRSNDILARRLDPAGSLAGDEFIVNVTREGNQTEPAAAMDSRGAFAVAWQGPGLDAEDIFLQWFDPNGRPAGDEMLINIDTPGRQLYPSVALSDSGTLAVAWESREIVEDVNVIFVRAQFFHSNAAAVGDEILINSGSYDSRYPDVAVSGAGGLVVAWLEEQSTNRIMARRFDPNGTPVAEPFEVSTANIASLTRPAVAADALGGFVIAWDGDPNRAGDDDIHARLYDPNGTPAGEPFIVNTDLAGAQQWPRVAMNDAGEFVVVWEQTAADPNESPDIFARQYDSAGQPMGEPFQVNTYTPGKQQRPDIVLAGDGSFIAAWESNDQDGSGYGIFTEFVALPTLPGIDW